jgi:hypothetical protein
LCICIFPVDVVSISLSLLICMNMASSLTRKS